MKFLRLIAATLGFVAAPLTAQAPIDWNAAETAFQLGRAKEGQGPSKGGDAAECAGRWLTHNNALQSGTFPPEALKIFDSEMGDPVETSMNALVFGRMTTKNFVAAYRQGRDKAAKRLKKARAGDVKARDKYFRKLGLCSFDRM